MGYRSRICSVKSRDCGINFRHESGIASSMLTLLLLSIHCYCVVIVTKSAREDFPAGQLIDVSEGASVTFNGAVKAQEVDNVDILFLNSGTMT